MQGFFKLKLYFLDVNVFHMVIFILKLAAGFTSVNIIRAAPQLKSSDGF